MNGCNHPISSNKSNYNIRSNVLHLTDLFFKIKYFKFLIIY